jgi:hypothetical protein
MRRGLKHKFDPANAAANAGDIDCPDEKGTETQRHNVDLARQAETLIAPMRRGLKRAKSGGGSSNRQRH